MNGILFVLRSILLRNNDVVLNFFYVLVIIKAFFGGRIMNKPIEEKIS